MSRALGWIVALAAIVIALRPAPRCSSVEWFPYEDADGFGYAEWRCDLPADHRGDHTSRQYPPMTDTTAPLHRLSMDEGPDEHTPPFCVCGAWWPCPEAKLPQPLEPWEQAAVATIFAEDDE